ncbi:hypothetical protein MGN70_001013 [Eutypa lata]|nr:hypothetical protein MGN70_001013 [Eutypa lata]
MPFPIIFWLMVPGLYSGLSHPPLPYCESSMITLRTRGRFWGRMHPVDRWYLPELPFLMVVVWGLTGYIINRLDQAM